MKNDVPATNIYVATLKQIKEIIDTARYFRDCYTWYHMPVLSESERKEYEEYHTKPTVTWVEGGNTYSASYEVKMLKDSRIIARGHYTRNHEKTTLSAVVNSYNRILQKFPQFQDDVEDDIFL